MARGERRVKSVEGVRENAKNNVFVFSTCNCALNKIYEYLSYDMYISIKNM